MRLPPILQTYWKQVAVALALLVLVAVAWVYRGPLQEHLRNIDEARQWFHSLGPLGPVALIGLNALQIVVAPIPGYFVQIAAGWVYGVWPGALYAIIGMALGATVAISLSRFLGRPFVSRVIGAERLARWEHVTRADRPWLWAILFLGPLGDIPYYLAGLSSFPIPKLVLTAVVVRSSSVVVATALGAGLVTLDERALFLLALERLRAVHPLWLAALVVVLVLLGYVAYRIARRLPSLWETQLRRSMQPVEVEVHAAPASGEEEPRRE